MTAIRTVIRNLFCPSSSGAIDISTLGSAFEVFDFIEDRLAGVTITERLWSGVSLNSAYVTRLISNEAVRNEVCTFFTSRALKSVFPVIIGGTATFRVGGYKSTVARILDAISAKVSSQDAAGVIMEMIMPALVANEIVVAPANSLPIMNRFTMPFRRDPDLPDLSREVARLDLERAVTDRLKVWSLDKNGTYSTIAAADELANALFPIGRALRSAYDYSVVISDMGKIVRVRLDPACSGLFGEIPKSILEHKVVDALVHNWTFIRYALSIPQGESISVDSSEFSFDKWAGAAIALLKSSDRFAFRSRADALRNYGLTHVEDLRGVRRAAVFYEHAEMEPVALSVVAINDDVLANAKNIDTTTGRIDAHLAVSYGDLCKTFSVQAGVRTLTDIVGKAMEMEAEPETKGVFVHMVRSFDLAHVAMMLADRVMYDPANPDDVTYGVRTTGRLELTSGVESKGYVYTRDPVEVLLASDACQTPTKADALPQLLPRAALGVHLYTAAEHDVFIKSGTRFTYNQTIGSATVRGSIRLMEFETSRYDMDASLVHPVYNDAVYRVARGVFESCLDVINTTKGGDSVVRRLKREYAQALITACRGIAPAFRASVHRLLVQKTMKGVNQEDVRLMSARLNQTSVRAFSDSFATAFFLAVQGIGVGYETIDEERGVKVADEAKNAVPLDPVITEMWHDADMSEMMVEFGTPSDRV